MDNGNRVLARNEKPKICSVSVIEITTEGAPVYSDNKVVGSLRKGEKFRYVYQDAKVAKLEFENSFAYVSSKDFKLGNAYLECAKPVSNKKMSIYVGKKVDVTNASGRTIFLTEPYRRYPVVEVSATSYVINIGGVKGYVKKTIAAIDQGIPVLSYHNVLKRAENKLYINSSPTISKESFDEQMRYLYQSGFETITLNQLYEYIVGKRNIGKKAVVLTFDDGLQSTYVNAYPTLKQYGFKAVNFMITGRISKDPVVFNPNNLFALSLSEMAEMKDVFTFEGHTHNLHTDLGKGKSSFGAATVAQITADLNTSKQVVPQTYFSYPMGDYNPTVIKTLKSLGYKMAVSTVPGYVNQTTDLFVIKRKGITPFVSFSSFQQVVNGTDTLNR